MKIGQLDVSKIMLGSDEVEKIYLGTEQVYGGSEPQPDPYSEQYFTTESLDDGNTISFTMGNSMTTAITTAVTSVSVSTDDGATWTSMENIGANASLSVTLDAGEKAIWKGVANGYSQTTATTRSTIFSSTGDYKVYGNILSLLYGDDFEQHTHTTLTISMNIFADLFYGSSGLTDASNLVMDFGIRYAGNNLRPFRYMFRDCTNLTNAPELKDIVFSNSEIWIFRDMFQNCTSLTTAPALPATTLSEGCYAYMFRGCTSLTTAPALPATTLASTCYRNMFYDCTSLTTAPELPATTLATSACIYMFYNCTSLNYIKCLATDISAASCTTNWVEGVSATGTFVKAASMNDWTTGTSGIPSNWTVQNDDGSLPVNDLEPDPTPPIENPEDIE